MMKGGMMSMENVRMKPGRRKAMNKIKKLYKYDRQMMVNWFLDSWPYFERDFFCLIEERVNRLNKMGFAMLDESMDKTTKKLNLDAPDNVIPFQRKA
jgi:hypothetical protein